MKNQFFGDNRDLFKYDLILSVVKGIDQVKQFTFIPMLTEDSGDHGNQIDRKRAKAGFNNGELQIFLDNCISSNVRNIVKINEYFVKKGLKTISNKEDDNFTHINRNHYFSQLRIEYLENALVFVDPDNGLEIKKSGSKHILYSEIRELYENMNENSVLMIFQFFPREKRKQYIDRRIEELKNITKDIAIYISDNVIIFFFLTKNDIIKNQLKEIIKSYVYEYPSLYYG